METYEEILALAKYRFEVEGKTKHYYSMNQTRFDNLQNFLLYKYGYYIKQFGTLPTPYGDVEL